MLWQVSGQPVPLVDVEAVDEEEEEEREFEQQLQQWKKTEVHKHSTTYVTSVQTEGYMSRIAMDYPVPSI